MSGLTLDVNMVIAHLNRMCEHDIDRLRKQLSVRVDKRNPDCWACQTDEKRERRRKP